MSRSPCPVPSLGPFPFCLFVCLSCPLPMCQFRFYLILRLSLRTLLGFYWKSGVVLQGREGGGELGRGGKGRGIHNRSILCGKKQFLIKNGFLQETGGHQEYEISQR